MRKLPIGIDSFKKIREEGYYYVDKTHFAKMLMENGHQYIISRPRGFGKSLFLDMLKEVFSGNRELFKGLYLYDNWDWNRKYPVVRFDFSKTVNDTEEKLLKFLELSLEKIANEHGIKLKSKLISLRFGELIKKLSEKHNEKVIILIDECDKPILDAIENIEIAKENKDTLASFYTILKVSDKYIRLAFLTTTAKFHKASIFSGLNHLHDITDTSRFSAICGYTRPELETVFADRLEGVNLEELEKWYGGYNWHSESVYNPVDILLFLDKKEFRPYWFESYTPDFLARMLIKHRFFMPELDRVLARHMTISNLDVERINMETLLFHMGYLTIKKFMKELIMYTLSYPNLEVRIGLNNLFLDNALPPLSNKEETKAKLIEAIKENNLYKLKDILYTFFASIPHDWYRKNDLEDYEGFYASVVYALFNGAGLEAKAEDTTNRGRVDLTIIYQDRIYVIEFKVVENEPENKALSQIKEKRYYEKYEAFKEIYMIGIEFSKKEKNIVGFKRERV